MTTTPDITDAWPELTVAMTRVQRHAQASVASLVATISEHASTPEEERPGLRRAFSLIHEVVAEMDRKIEEMEK